MSLISISLYGYLSIHYIYYPVSALYIYLAIYLFYYLCICIFSLSIYIYLSLHCIKILNLLFFRFYFDFRLFSIAPCKVILLIPFASVFGIISLLLIGRDCYLYDNYCNSCCSFSFSFTLCYRL